MKKYLSAVVLAAALAEPAAAVTFPSLTTIYVGSGVRDTGAVDNTGTATSFHCSNVSGAGASVRFLVLSPDGEVRASATVNLANGATRTASTHNTAAYSDDVPLSTGAVAQGVVNIESTQSAVFCSAMTINAAAASPSGVPLRLVRVNPHSGTVE